MSEGTRKRERVEALSDAWREVYDTLFACETEGERQIIGGCMNRILALSGRDPEKDPSRVRFVNGKAVFPNT